MMKSKVLMIGMFPPPYSSGERRLNATLKEIFEINYEVHALNVSTGRLNPSGKIAKLKNQISSIKKYLSAMRAGKAYTAVHHTHAFVFVTPGSSFGHIRDWIMVKFFIPAGVKKIVFVHNGNIHQVFSKNWHKRITKSFIKKIDKIIFLSEGLSNKMRTFFPESKIEVIANTVDKALEFSSDEIVKKISEFRDSKDFKVLYLSNMNPTKGYMDLANAIHILAEDKRFTKNIKCEMVGEWLSIEQENLFKNFIIENGLESIFTIHGKVSDRKKIRELYEATHVFCLPTYFAQEAQPLSIIEAMSAANPIISTNHASIPEYVFPGKNGYLVKEKSPNEIAIAIKQLSNVDTWTDFAKGSREVFESKFSRDIYIHNILNTI